MSNYLTIQQQLEDKIYCAFYIKVGACRYETNCLRIHNRPTMSQTVLIKHMYQNSAIETALSQGNKVCEQDAYSALNKYEEFYEEVFLELANYGEIEDLIICDNICEHMKGNVYVKYIREEDALKCINSLKKRYYEKIQLKPELSPVTDFSNAKCKQYEDGQCNRSGNCNYIHPKPIGRAFRRSLMRQMYEEHPEYKNQSNSVSQFIWWNEQQKREKEKLESEREQNYSMTPQSYSAEKEIKYEESSSNSNNDTWLQDYEERRARIAQWQEEIEQKERERVKIE